MLLSAESEWWNIEKFFILRCLDLFCDSPQGRDGETDYPPMVLDSLPQLRRIHISLMNRLVCDDRFSIFCNTFIRTSYILTIHPSPKVMVDFSRHKISTWCLHPISTMFGRFIKCMLVVIFSENIYGLLVLTRCGPRFKGDVRDFFTIKFEHLRFFHKEKFDRFR